MDAAITDAEASPKDALTLSIRHDDHDYRPSLLSQAPRRTPAHRRQAAERHAALLVPVGLVSGTVAPMLTSARPTGG